MVGVALPIFHLGKLYPIFRYAHQALRLFGVPRLAGLASYSSRPPSEIRCFGHIHHSKFRPLW